MKILVFEYITGGGFNKQALPESLAKEGLLMLRALLGGLTAIPGVELTVMLDRRMADRITGAGIHIDIIDAKQDCPDRFRELAETADAVWPVAPEFEGILLTLCRSVEKLGKILLSPASEAVALASDKFITFQCLSRNQIPTVATQLFDDCRNYPGESIIKPIDGAGCEDSYLIYGPDDFALYSERLHGLNRYILQPHLYGNKLSLSCLFKEGEAWLLSANLQKFSILNNQYHLSEIVVNYTFDVRRYRAIADRIASAVPGLWGYAGIDLIETSDQIFVLEINPRLTTSFAGIDAALGINAADLVLQLMHGDPLIERPVNRAVTIKVGQGNYDG